MARVCALILLLAVSKSCAAPPPVTDYTRANAAATAAQTFYRPEAKNNIYGLAWWQDAQAVEALCNLMIYSNTTAYLPIVESILDRDGKSFRIKLSGSYDDLGWWGLAYVRAYELTQRAQYLSSAREVFDHVSKAWDSSCGGGVWWSAKKAYKNAITNELFLTLAMKMHLHNNSESTYYLDWAQREWDWFKTSGMINANTLVNDGLNGKDSEVLQQSAEKALFTSSILQQSIERALFCVCCGYAVILCTDHAVH
jgi:predicted alpha-1,6-mannanase (GH76 family)